MYNAEMQFPFCFCYSPFSIFTFLFIFLLLGLTTFATCMILMTYVKCYKALGVLLLVIGIGASGFTLAALSVIPVDMSPNFSGKRCLYFK